MKRRAKPEPIQDVMRWSSACREHFFPWRAVGAGGSHDAVIAEAGITEACPGYELGRTQPRYHLLVYPTRGKGRVYTVDQESTVQRGQVFVAPAGKPFGYKPVGGPWHFLWFHLPITERWRPLRESRVFVRRTVLTDRLAFVANEFMRESRGRNPTSQEAANRYADLIGIYITREVGGTRDVFESDMENRLGQLWDTVNNDLERPWTVEDLAEEFGVASSHLHRLTRQYHGVPPMKMVTRLRMERAQDLLVLSDDSLRSIALKVGYQNEFAFSVSFKRFSGVSPGKFRKRR